MYKTVIAGWLPQNINVQPQNRHPRKGRLGQKSSLSLSLFPRSFKRDPINFYQNVNRNVRLRLRSSAQLIHQNDLYLLRIPHNARWNSELAKRGIITSADARKETPRRHKEEKKRASLSLSSFPEREIGFQLWRDNFLCSSRVKCVCQIAFSYRLFPGLGIPKSTEERKLSSGKINGVK